MSSHTVELEGMSGNKAAGHDMIVKGMLSALDNFGIDEITEVINEIYSCGHILENLAKSILVTLPMRSGANECELHRRIRVMSHITNDREAELDQK